jgi:nucleoside-diphosphate-sugar epimerase
VSELSIIGAGGFVGTSLIESLVLSGKARPRAVVRNYRNMAGLCRFGSAVDVWRANAEDLTALAIALEGADTVVNLTTGPPAGIVRSTSTIYDACLRARVKRLVHLSSAVVYGDILEPVDDDAPPISGHWMRYARAKAVSEIWLRERLGRSELEVVVLRPGIVWGVRSPHTIDLARSLASKSASLVNDGRGIFNSIYIANLVAAIRASSDHAGVAAGLYNVGDRETVTWHNLFAALGAPLGCDVDHLPRVSGERLPFSVGVAIDTVQNLPFVNELYHQLKTRVPDRLKAAIRAGLESGYTYERSVTKYASHPSISLETWHLQRAAFKLPIDKFARTFGFSPPVSFEEGIRKTVAWLASLGSVVRPQDLQYIEKVHAD